MLRKDELKEGQVYAGRTASKLLWLSQAKHDSSLEHCGWQEVIEFCINFECRADGISEELNVGSKENDYFLS